MILNRDGDEVRRTIGFLRDWHARPRLHGKEDENCIADESIEAEDVEECARRQRETNKR